MRIHCLFLLLPLAIAARAGAAPARSATRPPPNALLALDPARNEVIYLQPLMPTKLTFKTKERFGPITVGSRIVSAVFNEKERTLDLTPTVSEGRTAMNMTIGREVYTFVLIITNDAEPDYRRTYTVEEESGETDDYGAAGSARPMKPQDIDTVDIIRQIERAHRDATFRATLLEYRTVPIGKLYLWNNSPVTLVEVNSFAEHDLLVLKIEWTNATDSLLYLDSKQVEVKVAGKPIPVTARQQISNQLFPGQMDTMWLFIQGYRLSPQNAWDLVLPADAEAVRRHLRGQ